MGESLFHKIASNPMQGRNCRWEAFRREEPRRRITIEDLRRGRDGGVQVVTIKAKPDSVASHRVWEGMEYLLRGLSEQGITDVEVVPQLLFPTEGYVRGFYNAPTHKKNIDIILDHLLGRATKKITVEGKEKEIEDRSFPQAGLVSFILVARTGQDLIATLRGEDGRCGLMGPTMPELAVQEGKVTDLAQQQGSLRVQTSIAAGGDLDRSKVLNGWHCSDGDVAALREIAFIYGRHGLPGIFEPAAINYIMNGEVETRDGGLWRRIFGSDPQVKPTADILRFPIFDLLTDIARNRGALSGVQSIAHAAQLIASFYDAEGYNPRDMQAPDIELMLKEAALFAARRRLIKTNGEETTVLTAEDLTALGIKPERTDLTIIVGASGIGKTTQVELLASRGLRMQQLVESVQERDFASSQDRQRALDCLQREREAIESAAPPANVLTEIQGFLPARLGDMARRLWGCPNVAVLQLTTTRQNAGDAGSKSEEPDVFWGRALQGRYVAAEENYGVDYGILDSDLKERLLQGGAVVVTCGPEMAKVLAQRAATVAEDMEIPAPTVKVVYLQPKDGEGKKKENEVLKAHLEEREKGSGRPAADRIEKAKAAAKWLKERLGALTPADGVHTIEVTVAKAAHETATEVAELLGPAGNTLDLRTIQVSEPRVELVLRKYLREMVAALPGASVNPASADTVDAGVSAAVEDLYQKFLKEVFRSAQGRNPILPHEGIHPDKKNEPGFKLTRWIGVHVLMALAAVREGASRTVAYLHGGEPRLGALYSPAQGERGAKALKRVRDLFASISLPEEYLMMLLHDIGKLRGFWPHNHERATDCLVRELRLTKDFVGQEAIFKSEEDRVLFELVLKHHHLIGNCFQGAASPALFAELVSDDRFAEAMKIKLTDEEKAEEPAKQLETTAGHRAKRVKALLDRLLVFTVADVAGQRGAGYLSILRVETYLEIRDRVEQILTQAAQGLGMEAADMETWKREAQGGIAAYAQEKATVMDRISAMVSPLETAEKIDSHAKKLGFYERAWVSPAVAAAIRDEVIEAGDWEGVKRQLPMMVFPYFDGYLLAGDPRGLLAIDDIVGDIMRRPEGQRRLATEINVNLVKYLALCAQVAERVPGEKPVEFVMIDGSEQARPTTCGAEKVEEGATGQRTEGQKAFIRGLNSVFGSDGKAVGREIVAAGERRISLYQRGEANADVYTVKDAEGKIEFLIDTSTVDNGERAVVYVRLPGLTLTMPGEERAS